MKRINFFTSILITKLLITLFAVFTFSCETVKDVLGTPSISLKSVGIQSLDLEGITFKCDYSISNPYPVSFSIKQVAADILHNGGTFANVSTANGVSVAAMASHANTINFKVPYDTILGLAKSSNGKTSLPFSVKGSASLDLSSVPFFEGKSLSLPFNKDFNVPVFKPQFSVSDVKLQLPSVDALKNAFVGSGMNAVKAASLVASIIGGKQIAKDAFDGVNLNIDLAFNVNVSNAGSAPWKYALNNCSILTSSGTLADVKALSSASFSSSSAVVPMKASLNTLKAGAFIVQLINKSGKNPVFALDSKLSFTDLSYAPNIPLACSKEIPLSNISFR